MAVARGAAAAGAAGITVWSTDSAYADAPDPKTADRLLGANQAALAGAGALATGAAAFGIWAGVRGEW